RPMTSSRKVSPSARPIRGLDRSTSRASAMPPKRTSISAASWPSRKSVIRSRSSANSGASLMTATLFAELACHGPRARLALDATHHVGPVLIPVDRLARVHDACVALRRFVVETGALLGPLGLLGDRLEDETVRGRAGCFRRAGNTGLEIIGQADGGGAHVGSRCAAPSEM